MPWSPSSAAVVLCTSSSRPAGSLLRRTGSGCSGRFPPTPSPGTRDKSAAVVLHHGDEDERKPAPAASRPTAAQGPAPPKPAPLHIARPSRWPDLAQCTPAHHLRWPKAQGEQPLVFFPLFVGSAFRFGPYHVFFQRLRISYLFQRRQFCRKPPKLHAFNNSTTVHRIKIIYIWKLLRILSSLIICNFHSC